MRHFYFHGLQVVPESDKVKERSPLPKKKELRSKIIVVGEVNRKDGNDPASSLLLIREGHMSV